MLRTTLVRAQRSSTRSIQPLLRKHGRIIYDRNASSISSTVARYSSSVSNPPRQDLLEAYRELVSSGRLKWDDEQVRIVMKLRHLLHELTDYTPPPELASRLKPFAPTPVDARKPPSWWEKGRQSADQDNKEKSLVRVLTQEEELANLRTPKGIMVTGPPGTGKSLILSIFFDLLPTSHKKRWHYHAFTLFLYRQVFLEMERRRNATPVEKAVENMDRASSKGWRSVFANGRWEDGGAEVKGVEKEETIPFVIAKQMIQEYHILYFDEMQLVDASSAALLRDVLSWYWRLGGVIVTCSNRVPDDLYHHGVQKERMVGFLDALKARCEVVELDGGKDWRKGVWADVNKWYRDQREFDAEWTSAGGEKAEPVDLAIYGRRLRVPAAVGTTCRMTFSDLCEQPLGPADYISLASSFSTFFIDAMPILYLKNKNEARRLINLVDALYEARCQVFVQAETDVETLFFPDAVDSTYDTNDSIMAAEALSETLHTAARPNISSYNPSERATREKREETESKAAGAFGVLGIFTGEDERFAYKRAVSRLVEMTTSPTYSREAWIPVSAESRLWETNKATAVPPQILKSAWATPTPKHGSQDFATEAGYSRPERLTRSPKEEPVRQQRAGPREGAPVITEKHMWGVVEEWGEKVGKWGQGVKAFEDKDKKQ